jgi:hypothetical protein
MRKREGPRSGRSGSLPARTRPADRPLRWFDEQMLGDRFTAALAAHDGRDGAHCVHEWWMRGAFPAAIESALQRLWDAAAASVPDWLPMRYVSWLPLVYEVAGRFEATGRGRHNLYLVLLDYSDRRSDPYGLYVGMSRYPPAERFDQHKAGIRAAGSVLKRGLEVLPGPVLHLQRIPRAEAARIEIQLAEALGDAGLLVRGGH